MKILIPDSIQPFLDGNRGALGLNSALPRHPYVPDGKTDEYLLLHSALNEFVRSSDHSDEGTALDLGAGDGTLTRLLVDRYESVVALDNDKMAANRLEKIVGPLSVETCDAREFLASTKQKFRLIMMSHLFYYFRDTDWESILRLAIERLSPNGTLITCLWSSRGDAAGIFRMISSRRGEELYGERLAEILKSLGFGTVWEQSVDAYHFFPLGREREMVRFFSLETVDGDRLAASKLVPFWSGDSYRISQRDLFLAFRRH